VCPGTKQGAQGSHVLRGFAEAPRREPKRHVCAALRQDPSAMCALQVGAQAPHGRRGCAHRQAAAQAPRVHAWFFQ